MKIKAIIFIALSFVMVGTSFGKEKKETSTMRSRELKWFETKNCQKLTIRDFNHATDKKAKKEKVIEDQAQIKKLIDMIDAMPPDGEMMISFAPGVRFTELEFQCDSKKQTVEFYGEMIKTPGTSFYMSSENGQKQIFEYVMSLLK